MIRAVIFDLDGVLVDTAHYHYIAWKRLAAELGVSFTEVENEKLKGVSRMQSLEYILEWGHLHISMEEKNALAEKKNAWFVEYIHAIKPEELFAGVREFMEHLRARGIKVALASSSKNAQTVILLLGIGQLFDAIVDGSMIEYSKPNPEIFLLAASLLSIPPADCLVYEDAEAGVAAAIAAGMKCVGVGSPAQLGKANRVIGHTADIPVDELINLF